MHTSKLSSGLIARGRFNGLTIPRDLPSQIVEGPGAVLKRRKKKQLDRIGIEKGSDATIAQSFKHNQT
jgi:hypothetical protein